MVTRVDVKNQKIVITYQGVTHSLREWALITQRPYHTLYSRYKVNQNPDHVFRGITVNVNASASQ